MIKCVVEVDKDEMKLMVILLVIQEVFNMMYILEQIMTLNLIGQKKLLNTVWRIDMLTYENVVVAENRHKVYICELTNGDYDEQSLV